MRNKILRKRLEGIMAPRHFYIIETILKSFTENKYGPVSAQNLTERLSGDNVWEFFEDRSGRLRSPDLLEDIAYLHQRGYAYIKSEGPIRDALEISDKEIIFPTYKSSIVFKNVYGKDPRKINWKSRKVKRL